LINCMIKHLESLQSLQVKDSIRRFYLDHATNDFSMFDVPQNLLVTSASGTFDNACPDDTSITEFFEIAGPIDHNSIVLFMEESSSVTLQEVSSVSPVTISIMKRETGKSAQKSTHSPIALGSTGCEPGWLCDRCITSPAHGTCSVCSAVCNLCYIQRVCNHAHDQPVNAIIEYDINIKIPKKPERMIPRIIHQTWFEEINPLRYPELYRLHNSWKYSGWEYRFYNETETRAYIKEGFPDRFLEAYDALIPGAFKADLFRYLVLLRDGGVYADIDLLLETNLDTFVTPTMSFFTPRDDGVCNEENSPFCLWNGLLASAPGHPIMAMAAERMLNLVLNRADLFDMEQEICLFSGPDEAELWKVRRARVLLLSGPCNLGAALNRVLGKKNLLAGIELGWQPLDTCLDVPKAFTEVLIVKADKSDMEAHRFSDVERSIMLASTDMIDLTKSPLLPPLSSRRLFRETKEPEIPQHYSYLEFVRENFGSYGVYKDDVMNNEILKFHLHYDES
jgi:hypothetical protein